MLRMTPYPACLAVHGDLVSGSANPLWWAGRSAIGVSKSGYHPSALEFRVAAKNGASGVAPRRILPRRIRRWMGWDDAGDATQEAVLNSRTHEAYRRVVHRLRRSRSGESGTVVLVVTAVHGEGGSHVAKQLAAALVQAEQGRVLLVDGNLRSPSQHVAFGIQKSPGFVEVTAADPPVETGSLATSDVGFALLPAGQSDEDPIHFMRESIIAGAFDELRKSFDWVVVDGPPVTIYAEAATLSGLADATVLVVRAESTRAEVAERAKKTIADSGGQLVGAILNQRRYHIPDFIYRRL